MARAPRESMPSGLKEVVVAQPWLASERVRWLTANLISRVDCSITLLADRWRAYQEKKEYRTVQTFD